jgi:hypothetical protein
MRECGPTRASRYRRSYQHRRGESPEIGPGEVIGDRCTDGRDWCRISAAANAPTALSGNDVRLSGSVGSCSLSLAGLYCEIRTGLSDNSPGERFMRPPLDSLSRRTRSRKSASRKTPGTVVMRSLERRAVHAEREIRGFALRLAEEGNWTSSANKPHHWSPVVMTS